MIFPNHPILNYKFLHPDQLIRVVEQLPPDCIISTNENGNLCIADKNNVYIGYIDFLNTGEFVPNDNEHTKT